MIMPSKIYKLNAQMKQLLPSIEEIDIYENQVVVVDNVYGNMKYYAWSTMEDLIYDYYLRVQSIKRYESEWRNK